MPALLSFLMLCFVLGLSNALTPYSLRPVHGNAALGSTFVSWKLSSDAPEFQVAFELRVLTANSDIVSEMRVNSSQPRAMLPIPDTLNAGLAAVGLRYELRVLSSDGQWSNWVGNSYHRGPGPLRSNWAGADWVCTSPHSTDTRSSMLRHEFTTKTGVTISAAELYIVGLGLFAASLNGVPVNTEAIAP